jgi:hypothetical protein
LELRRLTWRGIHPTTETPLSLNEFEAGLKSGAGYYGVDSQSVRIVKLSDDIDKSRTIVTLDGENILFDYDATGKTITFDIGETTAYGHPWAGHNISATLVDTAGNEYALSEIENVYVGNRLARFWIFFAFGGTVIVAGAALFLKPWRKRVKA